MTLFYVFDTQQAAIDAVNAINTRGLQIAAGDNRQSGSSVVSVNAATGAPEPNAEMTMTWAIPIQTLLGKWVFPHPSISQQYNDFIPALGMTKGQWVTQDLGAAATAQDDSSWWPVPIYK